MTLQPGTRLGPYEIAAAIGAGGMGEVYRGRDATLNRDVAIKVLPAALAADTERLARFKREAQVLASLNHSNIAHIYGFEGATLADGTTAHFLAMELVPGEDLSERLRRGAIPVEEAIAIAKQIAEGLEEAHEHGIIHRDLKPANVRLTPDGKVKVLDFGLAKALEGDPASGANSEISHSPTMSRHMTEAGMIMGTAAYMSPEQARGKPVNKRSDIWSFGVVLFEMLSGTRLFAGETVSDTLAALLKEEVPWSRLPAGTPRDCVQMLRRCLTRDPRQRLRDMGDARLALADGLDAASGGGDPALPTSAMTLRSRRTAIAVGVLGGAVVAALATFLALSGGQGVNDSSMGTPVFSLRRLTELPGAELQPSLSPDGRMLVYASRASANLDLYLLRVGGDRSIPLTGSSSADDSQPAFSPDGGQIAFRSERDGGGLFIMGATGESVRRVTNEGFDPAWSPDGKRLVYASGPTIDPYSRDSDAELWTVEIASGTTKRLVATDSLQPAWSRDGKRIAYWANTDGQRDIWTVGASGGAPVAVTQDAATDWSPEWSPDGRWLYFSSDRGGSVNVWRIAIRTDTGETTGEAQPVTSGVRGMGYARFSSDGSHMTVMAYERSYEQTLFNLDPEGAVRGPIRTLRNPSASWCAASPHGDWLACRTAGIPEDLVLVRSDGSELRRLTSDPDKDRGQVWDPKGERLAFYSTRSGKWEFWSIRVDGSDLRQLATFGEAGFGVWSPDGRQMVLRAGKIGQINWLIDTTRLESAETARALVQPPGPAVFSPGSWSPEGDRIAGTLDDPLGQILAFGVMDLKSGAFRTLDVPAGGRAWGGVGGFLGDGRGLIARATDGVALIDTISGRWRIIAPAGPRDYLSLSRDGRVLTVEREVFDSDIWLIEFP